MELKLLFSDIYQIFKITCINFTIGIFNSIYIFIIFLIYLFYKRTRIIERDTLMSQKLNLKSLIFESTMHGVLAGFIASLIINFAGIHIRIDNDSLIYLWFLVMILAFLNNRYLCLSYAIGLLSLLKLIFGWPDIDVSGLLAFVGVLHFVEALLIWLNGDKDAMPIFTRHNDDVVGAFSIQKFWPLPIALLLLNVISVGDMPAEVVDLGNPKWWPLIKQPIIAAGQMLLFSIMAIPVIISYSDIIITENPKKRIRKSAILLSIYSIILIIISVISSSVYYMQYIAAFFAILGHGFLRLYWRTKEKIGKPYFVTPDKGVRILDTIKEGPAYKMGVLPGDVLLKINNKQLMTYGGIAAALEDYPTFIWIDVLRDNNKLLNFEYKAYPDGINDLKLIIVPRDESVSNILRSTSKISLFNKIIKCNKTK